MKDKIREFINTKQFHIIMVCLIIFIIIFIAGISTLKYYVEGDNKLPFVLSKISIISNVEGIDVEDANNKWNLDVNQSNDIYLYIKKNDDFDKNETIKNIILDNFNVEQSPNVGKLKLYKPDTKVESVIFKNSAENEVQNIEYTGAMDSSIKEMKISNQGGLVVFRYAITEIGNYVSNDDQEVKHGELLKKLSINNDDLKFKVTFDITINLDSNKSYKANMSLDLPVNDVVNNGTQSLNIDNTDNIIFRRI